MEILANIVDVLKKQAYYGKITIANGIIISKENIGSINPDKPYVLPGFVDSHVHIESSMVLPQEFALVALSKGTLAAVCDPHEIANVLGMQGIDFMIKNAKKTDFLFAFAAPSCVPASSFENSGAVINSEDIEKLMQNENIYALAEMMNYPGLFNNDIEVLKKINIAKKYSKPIDGHAPGLNKEQSKLYASYGITTDHECSKIQEAENKIIAGMNILIRQGSAVQNFETLYPLINLYPQKCMFCTDDCHIDKMSSGYINKIVELAVDKGLDIWNVLLAACVNPVKHYKLNLGLLQKDDKADFIIVDNLRQFNVLQTYMSGKKVFDCSSLQQGSEIFSIKYSPNNFQAEKINLEDIKLVATSSHINVIKAQDKELFTKKIICKAKVLNNKIVSDQDNDVLKLVVVNRYKKAKPSIAFIKGFGLKNAAVCSTIAHDSHNIIAVGTSDDLIISAINKIIDIKGGIICLDDNKQEISLPLPIAGLMSNLNYQEVNKKLKDLHDFAAKHHCLLSEPFMTLAFMALLVIPELKLSDKGLFDSNGFQFISNIVI